MSYHRNTFSASHEAMERDAGRCKMAATILHDKPDGDPLAEAFLLGADAAIRILMTMGEGNDEETFLSRVTTAWTSYGGERLEVGDAR